MPRDFIHLAGIIIGLGAVTVIDTMGFVSRNSVARTQTTIQAHHVTKPLIWLGTLLMAISWLSLFDGSQYAMMKSWIIVVLLINGAFLSFRVSPRLDALAGKQVLLPPKMQMAITVSMLISFVGWWTLVWLTV